jgi:hypothetical protein
MGRNVETSGLLVYIVLDGEGAITTSMFLLERGEPAASGGARAGGQGQSLR